jgi:hypothetical protein
MGHFCGAGMTTQNLFVTGQRLAFEGGILRELVIPERTLDPRNRLEGKTEAKR